MIVLYPSLLFVNTGTSDLSLEIEFLLEWNGTMLEVKVNKGSARTLNELLKNEEIEKRNLPGKKRKPNGIFYHPRWELERITSTSASS